jgi:hypothetical protein
MIAFEFLEQANDRDHTFAVYDCHPGENDDVVAVLADTIRDPMAVGRHDG